MPVRLRSQTTSLGRSGAALANDAAAFTGSFVAPPNRAGIITSDLQAHTSNIQGFVQAGSNVLGSIGVSLENYSALFTDATTQTNLQRINAILAGRTAPFSLTTPADPVTTRQVSVDNATDFSNEAGTAGTEITVTGSFSGNINISASDVDVIVNNNATITGNLDLLSSPSRVRWTGGNVVGAMNITSGVDVLFDDFYITTTFPSINYMGAGGNDRLAVINSTFEQIGSTSGDSWVWFVLNSADLHDDWFVGNVFWTGESVPSLVRFQCMRRLSIVDCVSLPTSGLSVHGIRLHDGCEDIWVKDTWLRGDLKMDNIDTPSIGGPSVTNAYWDNFDVYNPGGLTFTFFADTAPLQSGVANTGTVLNSTWHSQTGPGAWPGVPNLSDGGGNSQVAWDGSTIPDYSGVGAQRP